MTEQEGGRSSEKMANLVLSIFKGQNFVVKNITQPVRVFLRAKCPDSQPELALETGAVELTSSLTEPEFNSQLAWSVTKKQLKDLRSNRSIIKVTCFIVDHLGTETEVGYVVLHVKDATAFNRGVDAEPSKAITYPLLGTKDSWRILQPKVNMILHLEDLSSEKRPKSQPGPSSQAKQSIPAVKETGLSDKNLVKAGEAQSSNAANHAETKLLPNRDMHNFVWTVKEKDGYFQLGDSAEDDDLYILNTTVISASYLHCLWDGKSPRKRLSDNFFWQIKYEAYGCEIASDPFLLADEDESRRTFIGDKATARIRTNGATFFEYLQDSNIQFQVIRYQLGHDKELGKPEVMGICFASLSELSASDPMKREHRACMEVLSEWGTPRMVSVHEKPEIRVMFSLEAVPNFFKISLREMETNNNDVQVSPSIPPLNGFTVNDEGLAVRNPNNRQSQRVEERQQLDEQTDDAPDGTASVDIESISNTSNVRRLLQFEDENRQDASPPPSSSSLLTSPERRLPSKESSAQQQKYSEAPSCNFSESDADDTDNSSNKENLARIMPPSGEYSVTVELNRFWLKCRRMIKDSFKLSYVHPPIGVSENPVEFYAEALDPDQMETRHGFIVIDGSFTNSLKISKCSESLLNDPLTVQFCKTFPDGSDKCFALAMIPFGRIFAEKGHDSIWVMESSADVLKLNQNIKIGELRYKIKLVQKYPNQIEETVTKQRNSSFFPPSTKLSKPRRATDKYIPRDPEKMEKIAEDMREYRRSQEEMLKRQKEETEAAYLKILSDEAAKRDAERERVMSQKLAELEKKEKELDRQRKQLNDKEQILKQLDTELKEKARKLELEQESSQQHSSLAQRRLEEEHKIQTEGLKRRLREFQDENEKLKTKVLLLEKKMETKDSEIENLMVLKRGQPDVRLEQRVSLLEQENKSLKNLLREANGRKEQYKKQSLALCQKLSRMQEERDQELKDQNENLRLQILASKEHKELKKERKAVQDLSQTLKALQKETVAPTAYIDGMGDRPNACSVQLRKSDTRGSGNRNDSKEREEEIQRLSAERSKLLQTGAYTKYDSVIKEMERKMVSLVRD